MPAGWQELRGEKGPEGPDCVAPCTSHRGISRPASLTQGITSAAKHRICSQTAGEGAPRRIRGGWCHATALSSEEPLR